MINFEAEGASDETGIDVGTMSLIIMGSLTLYAILATYIEHKHVKFFINLQFHFINEPTIAIIVGTIAGGFLILTGRGGHV